jgi:uncharacterized repeat protein (TIGR04076 family)
MKKWYEEDWHFKIEVLKVGKENQPEECRLGLEPGDKFECDYQTPGGFCPTSLIKIFPVLETIRCEGDLRYLGANVAHEMEFICPDGVVKFKISGIKQE